MQTSLDVSRVNCSCDVKWFEAVGCFIFFPILLNSEQRLYRIHPILVITILLFELSGNDSEYFWLETCVHQAIKLAEVLIISISHFIFKWVVWKALVHDSCAHWFVWFHSLVHYEISSTGEVKSEYSNLEWIRLWHSILNIANRKSHSRLNSMNKCWIIIYRIATRIWNESCNVVWQNIPRYNNSISLFIFRIDDRHKNVERINY